MYCTNSVGANSAVDNFEVRILTTSLSASPNSGTPPLNNVSLTATDSGTSSGTFRYFFDCTNDGTNELDTGNIASNPYTASNLCNYASAGTYTAKVTSWHSEGNVTSTATVAVSVGTCPGGNVLTSLVNSSLPSGFVAAVFTSNSGFSSCNFTSDSSSIAAIGPKSNLNTNYDLAGPGGSAPDGLIDDNDVAREISANSNPANPALCPTVPNIKVCDTNADNAVETLDNIAYLRMYQNDTRSVTGVGPGTTNIRATCNYSNGATGCVLTPLSLTVVDNNVAPSAASVVAAQADNCASGPSVFVSWTYTDANNNPIGTDPQSAYQVQIDDNGSSFNTPLYDSGKVASSSSTQAFASNLPFNKTLKARVKVWDSRDVASNWTYSGSWTTEANPAPSVNFTWSPLLYPSVKQPVQFTDQTICYDNSGNPTACTSTGHGGWSWTFGDGGTSTQQNPLYTYLTAGSFSVTDTVTDKAGAFCSLTKQIYVNRQIPTWKEVSPK